MAVDVDQARAEVLAYARRLGTVLRRTQRHGGDGGDSSTFHDTNLARLDLDKACVDYANAIDPKVKT